MRALWEFLRRLVASLVVVVGLVCTVEVVLRAREAAQRASEPSAAPEGIPREPSRQFGWESPAVWSCDVSHPLTGKPFELTTNSLGLRGAEPAIPKPAGTLRIVCLGDETTLAPRLPAEECYPSRLRELLGESIDGPVEVINAGQPGGYPLTEYLHYRQVLRGLSPDVVLWHVDVTDAREEQELRRAVRVDSDGMPVAVVHPSLDVPDSVEAGWVSQLAVFRFARDRSLERLSPRDVATNFESHERNLAAWNTASHSRSPSAAPPLLAPLAALRLLAAEDAIEVVITTCPNAWQTSELLKRHPHAETGTAATQDNNQLPSRIVEAFANEHGISFLDATPKFVGHAEPAALFLSGSAGLSPEGHALYAEALLEALTAAPQQSSAMTTEGAATSQR